MKFLQRNKIPKLVEINKDGYTGDKIHRYLVDNGYLSEQNDGINRITEKAKDWYFNEWPNEPDGGKNSTIMTVFGRWLEEVAEGRKV